MVSGNPYISVKSATRKAVNAPNDRQSRAVRGWVKLNAKMAKTATLMTTRDQRPYAGVSEVIGSLRLAGGDFPRVRRGLHHARGAGSGAAGPRAPAATVGSQGRGPDARSRRKTRR